MVSYQVQKGDTIAQVTKRLNTDWQTLKQQNPNAVGRSNRNGNWFLREGATVNVDQSFEKSLQAAAQQQESAPSVAQTSTATLQLMDMAQPFIEGLTADAENGEESVEMGETIEHTVQPGETIWDLAVNRYHVDVDDILAENGILEPKSLQVGQKLTITLPQKGDVTEVTASWYGEDFQGKTMANGEAFDMNGLTIAHKDIPLGTRVELTNTTTGETVQAIVSDRGPYVKGRDVDLSYGLAKRLSLVEQGVGTLEMRIL